MNTLFDISQYDLASPDGPIISLTRIDDLHAEAIVFIENISPRFVGFQIDPSAIFFNIKSTLAQVGLDGIGLEYELDKKNLCAQVRIQIRCLGLLAKELLDHIQVGAHIGRLFAADERRRVRSPDYLSRMFGRCDRWGKPLLSLGGLHGSNDLILDVVDGRTIAYLTLQNGKFQYEQSIHGFLPTLAKSLHSKLRTRDFLRLHQKWVPNAPRNVSEDEILLARTLPLHIRTVFARVVDGLLSQGYHHTTASILQPDTEASGDIYELYGQSKRELTDIPLEFYTLEPYREYVYFNDRDQLKSSLEDPSIVLKAFDTAPEPLTHGAATFIAKGEQLLQLKAENWITRESKIHDFPGVGHGDRQGLMVERYISQQPSYQFLKAMDDGDITSQGIILTRFFPSPLMKRMLLSNQVQKLLKGIYFQYPSLSFQDFFSAEDRALLHDLEKFAIPVYWADKSSGKILQYIQKPDRDSGLFVPLKQVDTFLKATVWGIYGSNLIAGDFERELHRLLSGILEMQKKVKHPLLDKNTPIALVTGGGPGAMEVGNRVAKELGILSCANVVDFRPKSENEVVNEQHQNPYIEAKMTYRLDKLVERQAEFHLDFPIFLMGGIGTDFEYSLEEVRRKVGATPPTPVLLFGSHDYWKEKITSRYRCNLETGTIKGSEWLATCFYCVQTAEQALSVYERFFLGTLAIGKKAELPDEGFVSVIL
jgi:predicted Rossmann-fold nucleotide-binding protein